MHTLGVPENDSFRSNRIKLCSVLKETSEHSPFGWSVVDRDTLSSLATAVVFTVGREEQTALYHPLPLITMDTFT